MAQHRLTFRKSLTPAEEFDAARDSFFRHCQAKSLSPKTERFYRCRLAAFTRYLDEQALTLPLAEIAPSILRDFLAWENNRNSAATAKHSYVTLQAFFRFLVEEGIVHESPLAHIERVRQKSAVIPAFTPAHIETLLNNCGKDFLGVRDRAILLTLVDCGLRVSELCGLTLDAISWSESLLQVDGKGNKERHVPFGRVTRLSLLTYLNRRGEQEGTKTFFVNCFGGPLRQEAVREMIRVRCHHAGIHGIRCSPHTFRHTFAVMYLRNGGDVFTLQKLLGHTDLTMTRRYAELSQTDVVDKHRACSPGDRFAGTLRPKSGRKRLK